MDGDNSVQPWQPLHADFRRDERHTFPQCLDDFQFDPGTASQRHDCHARVAVSRAPAHRPIHPPSRVPHRQPARARAASDESRRSTARHRERAFAPKAARWQQTSTQRPRSADARSRQRTKYHDRPPGDARGQSDRNSTAPRHAHSPPAPSTATAAASSSDKYSTISAARQMARSCSSMRSALRNRASSPNSIPCRRMRLKCKS